MKIILTVDTDSDYRFGDYFKSSENQDKSIQGWGGFEKGKDILSETIRSFADQKRMSIPITRFVRCDRQIESQYGEAAYLLNEHKEWWEDCIRLGDDIQWHAHLYEQRDSKWIQATDESILRQDLCSSLKHFKKTGFNPTVVRIGESFHTNEMAKIISDLGLFADSTAMPGRRRKDAEKTIDWEVSPNYPYHPSVTDYRTAGKDTYSHWEIPMNTVLTQVSYDERPLLRYINPAFQAGVLDRGLDAFIEKHDVLVTITHPFEVLPEFFKDSRLNEHPLLSFESDALIKNLEKIFEIAEAKNKKLEFITMASYVEELIRTHEKLNC